jgi:hypothetical protein
MAEQVNLSPSRATFRPAGIKGIDLAVYHAPNDLIAFGKAFPEEG